MSPADREKLVEEIVLVAISIGQALSQRRQGDVKKYTDEIRELLREALAD